MKKLIAIFGFLYPRISYLVKVTAKKTKVELFWPSKEAIQILVSKFCSVHSTIIHLRTHNYGIYSTILLKQFYYSEKVYQTFSWTQIK